LICGRGEALAFPKTNLPLFFFFSNVSSAMLMEHFLCDDAGGKHNVCEMELKLYFLIILFNTVPLIVYDCRLYTTDFNFVISRFTSWISFRL